MFPMLLIVGAFLGLGVYLLYLERALILKGFQSYKWPRVKAEIKDQQDASFSITGYSYYGGSGTVRFSEIAYIYEYKVGDHIYHANNYCFGGHLERAVATFTIGQHIFISYNPDDPKESVIKCGLMPGALIGILPIVLAMIGMAMMALS